MSLTDKDLEKIGDVVNKSVFNAFSSIWEHNLEPALSNLATDLASKPSQHHVDTRFKHLEEVVIAETDEASIIRDRKLDEKTNVVAHKLGTKTVFTRDEVIEVERITPFAVKPATE